MGLAGLVICTIYPTPHESWLHKIPNWPTEVGMIFPNAPARLLFQAIMLRVCARLLDEWFLWLFCPITLSCGLAWLIGSRKKSRLRRSVLMSVYSFFVLLFISFLSGVVMEIWFLSAILVPPMELCSKALLCLCVGVLIVGKAFSTGVVPLTTGTIFLVVYCLNKRDRVQV